MNNDRLFFTFMLAAIVHACLILGISFTRTEPTPPAKTLEITIAQHESKQAPDEADFLAQANQAGSGTLEKKTEISTTELAEFYDNQIRELRKKKTAQPQHEEISKKDQIVTSLENDQQKVSASEQKNLEEKKKLRPEDGLSLAQRSMEISSLEAQLREQKEAFAKRPRRRQLTSMATRASHDAAYLDAWRRKIELVGNLNYPNLKVFGTLTLLVSIRNNGTVERIEVRRSSGYPELDAAAIRIVRLASPFAPFPDEIKKHTDILEIIRTWKFEQGRVSSSS